MSGLTHDPALRVDDLVKVYGRGDSARHAVDGLSFAVPRGAIFGLLGPNGAGKTTSARTASGWPRALGGHGVLALDVRFGPHGSRVLDGAPRDEALGTAHDLGISTFDDGELVEPLTDLLARRAGAHAPVQRDTPWGVCGQTVESATDAR